MIPEALRQAAAVFAENGAPLYLVGGWPRNRLLGLPPGDLDISSALPPREAAALFAQVEGARAVDRDTRLGTMTVLFGGAEAEYTPFRTESYGEGGAHRPDCVSFGATMRQDALRRDFTVNALYYDIAAGRDEDPLGGLADLNARVLRTCRPPRETFADDGLRLMRLARFAAELGFGVEEETLRTAQANAPMLGDIAPERIQAELNKILLCDKRYPDQYYVAPPVLEGLRRLDRLGLLGRIAPEFEACRGVTQRADYHDFDVLEHLLHACAAAPADLTLRLAALLHDIGKPEALKRGGRMAGHDRLGEEMARVILLRLRYPNDTIDAVTGLIGRHMTDLDGRMGRGKLRLFFARQGRKAAHGLVELRRADVAGSKAEPAPGDPARKWVEVLDRMDAEAVPWTLADLAVDGRDLSALAGGPSPTVGLLKRALHEYAVLHPRENTKEALLRQAARLLADRQRFPGGNT